METTLPHTVVNYIPVINLRDGRAQKALNMDFATSEGHVSLYANVYRKDRKYKHPVFLLGERAFFSIEEAFDNSYEDRPELYLVLVYEGIVELTVRQARRKRMYWGQDPALVKEIAKRKTKLTRVRDIDDLP